MERKNYECQCIHIWRSRTRSIGLDRQCVHDKPPDASNDWPLAPRCRPSREWTWSVPNTSLTTSHASPAWTWTLFSHCPLRSSAHETAYRQEWTMNPSVLVSLQFWFLLGTRRCSHLITTARYIDCGHHRCSRRSRCCRHRLARRLPILGLDINYNFILRYLLSCRPIEYDSFVANYVVTNIYQPRLTIIL